MRNIFTAFLCIILSVFFRLDNLNAQINKQDSLALVDLYSNTNGPGWSNHTNWLTSAPVSLWNGITVTANRVTSIVLVYNNLNGTIPTSIGNLTNLDFLSMWGNHLTGSIPSSFGNLTKLTICALEYNQLSGNLPASFKKLTKLISLELDGNQFTGEINQIFSKFTQMIYLSVYNNQFTGSISFLKNMQGLHYVDLNTNQFTGRIPVLPNIDSMGYLSFGHNLLSGSIPRFRQSDALVYLQLDYNLLSGSINHQFDSLSNPYLNIFLSHNQLTGSLPTFENVSNLHGLVLSYNHLTGNLPDLDSLKNLEYLNLSNNNLNGYIPESLGKVVKLITLDLSSNQLNGTTPSSLSGLTKLLNLYLDSNHFTFTGMENIASQFSFAVYSPQAKIKLHRSGNKLSVSAGGTLANNTYKWYKNGRLFKTKTGDSVVTVSANAAYDVKVTNSVATRLTLYSDTLNYTTFSKNINSKIVQTSQHSLMLYPNPAKDIVWVQATGNNKFSITNADGKKIYTTNTSGNFSINVKAFTNGIYYLQNENTKEIYTLIIAH